MTIFGTKQALFYVDVPPHPPQPATQKSYILSEGQSEDDIEVTRIDEKTGVITFNNHGVVQEIPLVKAPPITTPTPVVMRSTPDMRPAFGRDFNTGRGEQPSMNNVTKLTPEERMVIIAAEKAKAKQEGNPIWKIFPPTDLDEAAGTVNSTSDTPPSP